MKKRLWIGLILGLQWISTYFLACKSSIPSQSTTYNYALHDSIDSKVLDTFINHHPSIAGIKLNSITKLSSGLRYQIVQDTGRTATTGLSNVTFSYSLRIPGVAGINGIIDTVPSIISNIGYTINPLNHTIAGLSQGLQLIHKNGQIILFIPSTLGFRDQSVNFSYLQGDQTIKLYTAPPNTVLVYNITLTSVF